MNYVLYPRTRVDEIKFLPFYTCDERWALHVVIKRKFFLHLSMLHTWQSSLDKGHSVRLLLVDFSKAFDRVNHSILFQKLLDRNVPQCLLRWLFSYLSLRQQRTRAKRKTSNWQYLNGSMPQGSLLGPLAFLVQIDDLAPGCLTHKYVDDTKMTEILTSATSASQMQSFICTLINWTLENDMRINTSKTKELVIGPWCHQHNAASLQTDSGAVERVHDFKLLGVCRLNFVLDKTC